MKISTIMILAAGLGKRMGTYTNNLPKPLIKIKNKTLIEIIIKKLISNNFEKVVINLFYLKDKIKKKLIDKYKIKIFFSEEKKLLNTGGGIKKALKIINSEEFFVINSDIILEDKRISCFKKLNNFWDKNKMDALLLLYPTKKIKKKVLGDFTLDKSGRICKQETSPFIFTGVQILKSSLFSKVNKQIFPMQLIYNKLIKKKRIYGLVHDGKWFHIGTIESLKEYRKMLK